MLTKMERCRHCYPDLKRGFLCTKGVENVEDGCETNEEICEKCSGFISMFIEYPITVSNIENVPCEPWDTPCLCKVRPCGDEYKGKTYLGLYLGHMPDGCVHTSHNRETNVLKNICSTNPAIYIFELNKVVWGKESWWSRIKSIDNFKEITDEDIDNTWYVRLLRDMQDLKSETGSDTNE